MLTVVDRPLIQHVVDEARAGRHRAFHLRHRPQQVRHRGPLRPPVRTRGDPDGKASARPISKRSSRDLPDAGQTSFTRQQSPLGLGHAVWCARDIVGNEPFALLLPDVLVQAKRGCLAPDDRRLQPTCRPSPTSSPSRKCRWSACTCTASSASARRTEDAFEITGMVEKPTRERRAVEPHHHRPLHPAAGNLRHTRRPDPRRRRRNPAHRRDDPPREDSSPSMGSSSRAAASIAAARSASSRRTSPMRWRATTSRRHFGPRLKALLGE